MTRRSPSTSTSPGAPRRTRRPSVPDGPAQRQDCPTQRLERKMPSWSELEPFIVSGLALGGVYALSGVGLVVLYRATGVLYLAFGAVGALGALTAWSLAQAGAPAWLTWLACVAVAAAVTLGYGTLVGPALAKRDPLVKAVATIGLTLILYGLMDLLWTTSGGQARSLALPTDNGGFTVAQIQVT